MGRTYVIGKIGKSIKFNPSTWGAIGGDNEAPTLYLKLAELNPDDTFIMIGKSDLYKMRGLPTNLHDGWAHYTKGESDAIAFITNHLKNTKVDAGIMVAGPTGDVNFQERIYTLSSIKAGKPQLAKTLFMHENYSGPIYDYLNDSMIPWIMINNDPRYLKLGRDMFNMPKEILSQYDSAKLYRHISSYEDQTPLVDHRVQYRYAGVEKVFLIDKELVNIEKTKKFMVVLNEGNNGVSSRYNKLKEYVLDHVEDVDIYGKWDEDTVKGDKRFKGSIKFEELQQMLPEVKYSFMISIRDGWVTMKVWELISNGIIPFLHPNYDDQHHIAVPEFLRLSKPEELHERIEQLEKDPVLYNKILQECQYLITPDDTSGEVLCNKITSTINNYRSSTTGTKSYDEVLQEIADDSNDLTHFFG